MVFKKFIPLTLFFGLLAVYIHNLSRSIFGGDVGDLVTASYVFGVPHAPGYPLFTFLGFLFSRLSFLGETPAFWVGMVSSVSAALAIAFLYALLHFLTRNRFVSLIISLSFAFFYYFWIQAEIAEVFALNMLFAILLLYLTLLFRKNGSLKLLFLFSFLVGLSLTHHQTIVLLFPSLFILIFTKLIDLLRKNPLVLLYCFLLSLLGFSFYIYVPIASFLNPVVNWDNVHDIPSFLHLVFRKDYGTFSAGLFASITDVQRIVGVKIYLFSIISQMTIPLFVLCLFGLYKVIRSDKVLALSILLAFILSGPFFIFYAGFPITGHFFIGVYERFFLLSTLFPFILSAFGLLFLASLFAKYFKKYLFLFYSVFLLIPILLFFYNFPKTNFSKIWLGDNLAYDILSPAPQNAAILLSGDTILFNSWYLRYVRNVREDIQVININGVAGDQYLSAEQKKYLKKHPKANSEEQFFGALLEIARKRRIFSISQLQPSFGERLTWVPVGILYEFYPDASLVPSKEEYIEQVKAITGKYHLPDPTTKKSAAAGSLSLADIPVVYANAFLTIGNYLFYTYKDPVLALEYYQKGIKLAPDYGKAYAVLAAYYFSNNNDCGKARDNYEKAISLDQYDRLSYFLLYTIYRDCLKDKNAAKIVVARFNTLFEADFFKEVEREQKKLQETNKRLE